MDAKLLEEQKVLDDKRNLINQEIKLKTIKLEQANNKLKQISKEIKGNYSVEKETFNLVKSSLEMLVSNSFSFIILFLVLG